MADLAVVLAQHMAHALADRDLGSGGQVWVSHRGVVVANIAVGSSHAGAMTTDTVHGCWCLTKPVVALAAAAAIERAGFPPSVTFAEVGVHHQSAAVRDVRILDALAHRTPFGRPALMEARLHVASERRELLNQVGTASYPLVDRPTYSEWVTGALLEEVLTVLAGEPGPELLQRSLDAAGLVVGLWPAGPTLQATMGCLRWLDSGTPGLRPPLLHDLAEPDTTNRTPALGGVTSMGGIGAWYALLARGRHEVVAPALLPSPEFLAECLATRRQRTDDPVLGRPAAFAGGFMVDLADSGFGEWVSPGSVGHLGWSGGSWAFFDPESDLVVAAMVNGATLSGGRFEMWRTELIDTLYRGLGS